MGVCGSTKIAEVSTWTTVRSGVKLGEATRTLTSSNAGVSAFVSAELPPGSSLLFRGNLVYAFADSGDVVAESDETNNYASSASILKFLADMRQPLMSMISRESSSVT